MTTTSLGSQRRLRLWTSRLWILAVVLGITAVASTVGLIHDSSSRRKAATLVVVATAQQVADEAYRHLTTVPSLAGSSLADLSVDSSRQLARLVFPRIIGDNRTLAYLDSMSLRVTRPDGQLIFGALDPDHLIRASLHENRPGISKGLTFDVALAEAQVPHALMMPLRHTAIFHNALLFFATALVATMAVISARKETALASARGDFIAGVSHDLRMPLAQILLASETLTMRDDLDEAEKSSLAHSVVRESKRLIGLVENILLFSRSGASELKPRRDVVMISDLLNEVVDATRLAADDAGQTLRAEASASLSVIGDARLLRQAVVNLVDNAIKYGPRGQEITLSAERVNGSTRITVDDQGPGIPRPHRSRVFEAYERLGRDESSERTGSGLGLAVVAYIAHASGGRVWLDDAPRRGTRAVFELPA